MSDDGKSLETVLSQALLGFSGGFGLPVLYSSLFASFAYEMSLVSGIVGVISRLIDNETLKKINLYLEGLSQCLVVPLIACEVCCAHQLQLEIAVLQLICPIGYYVTKYIVEKDISPHILHASHGISICAVAYFSFLDQNWWGVGVAVMHTLCCIATDVFEEHHAPTLPLAIGNFIYSMKVF